MILSLRKKKQLFHRSLVCLLITSLSRGEFKEVNNDMIFFFFYYYDSSALPFAAVGAGERPKSSSLIK